MTHAAPTVAKYTGCAHKEFGQGHPGSGLVGVLFLCWCLGNDLRVSHWKVRRGSSQPVLCPWECKSHNTQTTFLSQEPRRTSFFCLESYRMSLLKLKNSPEMHTVLFPGR